MSPVVTTPDLSMAVAGLVVLLLVLAPLVLGIVLAVRGRPGRGALVGGLGVIMLLLIGGFVSVRTVPRIEGEAESHAAWSRDAARRETVLHAYRTDVDYGHLQSRFAHDDRVHVRPDGVYVDERGGEILIAPAPRHGPKGDAWRDAARQHEERLLLRRQRDGRHGHGREPQFIVAPHGPPVEAELVSEEELPDWVQTPPANRIVVTGPLVADEDGGPAAARRAAEAVMTARLLEDAGLPPGAAINPRDVPHPSRVAVLTLTRTTGENTFKVYRGYLLVDATADVLHRIRQGHRNRLGHDRALWVVGGAGACVLCFAGLWGVGRRKLRGPAAGVKLGEG